MKKAEFKQYMLEKGEQVGLYVAAGIAGLLLVLTLFLPGHGLFSSSTSAKVEALDKEAKAINQARQAASPKDSDRPPPLETENAALMAKTVRGEDYRGGFAMIEPPRTQDNKRVPPEILKPTELVARLVRAQLQGVEFEYENAGDQRRITKVWVVKGGGTGMMGGGAGVTGGGAAGTPGLSGPALNTDFTQFAGKSQKTLSSRPGPGGGRGFNPGGGKGMQPETDTAAKLELVEIAKAVESKATLATKVLPKRMVVIEGSFPYKGQVERFKVALRLSTHGEVLTEKVRGEKKNDKFEEWSAFQFRGLEVERMTLSADGKETTWEKVPEMLDEYKRIAIWVGKHYEDEDPKLKPIRDVSFGLFQPRPKLFEGADRYPEIALQLPTIKTTLESLQGKGDEGIKTSHLTDEDFNTFGDAPTGNQPKQPGPGPGPGGNLQSPDVGKQPLPGGPDGGKPPIPGKGDDPFGSISGKGEATKLAETKIQHCMIRFIDPTVEEGKTYRYRVKVKMANPNYSTQPEQRKDTYPDYARKKELTSEDWAELPNAVAVPHDEHLYVVDQADVRKDDESKFGTRFVGKPRDKPAAGGIRVPDGDQVALQIHRWFDYYRPNPERGDDKPVGEWLIADRLLVERGGILRQVFPTEVPVKHLNQQNFELDSHTWNNKDLRELLSRWSSSYPHFTKSTMPVIFGDESVLVDFSGGKLSVIRKEQDPNPKVKEPRTVVVDDRTPTEVLIQRPDGSVIAHNGFEDAYSSERKERYEKYVKGLETIGKKKNPGAEKTAPGSPFGGGKP